MNKTLFALLLALNAPLLHAQATGKQAEFTNPPTTRGSGISRADVKAQERAEGSLGIKQSEYTDPARGRKGAAAVNDGAPTNDPFAKSRDEKAQARSAYKKEKSIERAEYKQAKKASASGLKASGQRSDTEKNLDVPK